MPCALAPCPVPGLCALALAPCSVPWPHALCPGPMPCSCALNPDPMPLFLCPGPMPCSCALAPCPVPWPHVLALCPGWLSAWCTVMRQAEQLLLEARHSGLAALAWLHQLNALNRRMLATSCWRRIICQIGTFCQVNLPCCCRLRQSAAKKRRG